MECRAYPERRRRRRPCGDFHRDRELPLDTFRAYDEQSAAAVAFESQQAWARQYLPNDAQHGGSHQPAAMLDVLQRVAVQPYHQSPPPPPETLPHCVTQNTRGEDDWAGARHPQVSDAARRWRASESRRDNQGLVQRAMPRASPSATPSFALRYAARSPAIRSRSSSPTNTSRGFEPSGGPSTPARWSWSMIRAARP